MMLLKKILFIAIVSFVLLLGSLFEQSHRVYAQTSCSMACHIIKPYEQGLDDKKLLLSSHVDAGLSCIDCHEQTDETKSYEKQLYESGEYDDPIVMREFDSDFCFRCHDGYEELAEKTITYEEKWHRNPHKSHLEKPDCYECHRMHRPSNFVCGSCHSAKWEERLPQGWIIEQ